jgi:hypothetical protein
MFILQNTPDVPKMSLGEVTLYSEESVHTTSIFDMTFYVRESSNGINCTVEYSTDHTARKLSSSLHTTIRICLLPL